ncbi:hypothetical protein A3K34_03950 [candidate division WWE3 bacterium RIFOXYC1_FULL_40_10]|nr:MAG: hypothetical protein A3K58_03950 [candidate division WWE3 bacterium RIFOXYB1_FULL_40_22]OGC61994.1 MAG: hypothetical protein A3K37_03950 [candidate division WWE3 bacterium RIFOXYA1_FULL_40_11]OGC66377.1 MAG: hypothetical protein A3K34_03950 [candidate division WWE3 bacterium RIFOXYC1_FULL_40_10]OGC70281.1 MAG: hypothetical protein A2602_04390 [candidate division WWE3 bacterium RIFOXYD1_FULL_40_11]
MLYIQTCRSCSSVGAAPVSMTKTYFIKTYGCQANLADSANIAGIFENLGFTPLDLSKKEFKNAKAEDEYVFSSANLVIINSCSVRQKSEDKVYGLGKTLKGMRKKPYIILTGCVVGSACGDRSRYSLDDLKRKVPWVDLFLPTPKTNNLKSVSFGGGHAYVNISTGCDNFCTYCVVPYARGEEISRLKAEILAEFGSYIEQGVTKFTLCGQNVNSWGLAKKQKFKIRAGSNQKLPFANLLRALLKIEGVKEIDFISSNPFDFTSDLVNVLKHPKIKNYIHIAVQSGNNEILKKMNRRHSVEDFIGVVEQIYRVRPRMEIGTDIIVGFPGETREQFMDTVSLVERVHFNVAFISMYSERKGTIAQKTMKDDIPREEKKWRHDFLTKAWKKTAAER